MRYSVSETALAQPESPKGTDSLKGLTLHDLSLRGSSETADTPELSLSAEARGHSTPSAVNFLLRPEDASEESEAGDELSTKDRVYAAFPEGFHPRRSSHDVKRVTLYSSPILKNPFMSPLLAPDSMLQTLPPVHIVVSARQGRWSWQGAGRAGHRCTWGREPPGEAEGGGMEEACLSLTEDEGRPGNG